MIVKKSTIIIISAISVLLMWCAWNLGVSVGHRKAASKAETGIGFTECGGARFIDGLALKPKTHALKAPKSRFKRFSRLTETPVIDLGRIEARRDN